MTNVPTGVELQVTHMAFTQETVVWVLSESRCQWFFSPNLTRLPPYPQDNHKCLRVPWSVNRENRGVWQSSIGFNDLGRECVVLPSSDHEEQHMEMGWMPFFHMMLLWICWDFNLNPKRKLQTMQRRSSLIKNILANTHTQAKKNKKKKHPKHSWKSSIGEMLTTGLKR